MTSTTPTQDSTGEQAAVEAVSHVASTAKERAASVAGASKDEAQAVMNNAKAHTKEVLAQSRDQLRQQADEQLRHFAGTVSDIGRQLTSMAQGSPETGPVVDVTNDLASSVARFGERIEERGVDGTIGEVTRFARTRPGLFLLASLGGGMMVGRLLRSADQHALADAAKPESSDGATPAGELDLTAGPES
jgi:hypothetical protein